MQADGNLAVMGLVAIPICTAWGEEEEMSHHFTCSCPALMGTRERTMGWRLGQIADVRNALLSFTSRSGKLNLGI